MYLYHGVLAKNLESMIENGVNPNSFWGEEYEAASYTDCNKIIKIDSSKYTIYPNLSLADSYEETDCEPELIDEWNNSKKTWEDSLRLFGSIIIEDRVFF